MKISQLSTFIENRSGRLRAACEALAASGINIHTLCLADSRDFGILRLILTDVLAVEVADSAGGLARVLATTDEAGLDIEYMYAFSTAPGQQAVVIIRFSDPDRALAELQRRGLNVVEPVKLLQG
jgi:hypothetical protein